jgi:hypothetical protein
MPLPSQTIIGLLDGVAVQAKGRYHLLFPCQSNSGYTTQLPCRCCARNAVPFRHGARARCSMPDGFRDRRPARSRRAARVTLRYLITISRLPPGATYCSDYPDSTSSAHDSRLPALLCRPAVPKMEYFLTASCGVVVASDIPVHREVYRGAADYFDPRCSADLVRAIKAVGADPFQCRR